MGTARGEGSARVTFSSKMSNCLRTELRSCCECSSITRIFHLEGGLTERMASKNSAREASMRVPATEREDRHTVPDDGDEGGHASEWLATARAALYDGQRDRHRFEAFVPALAHSAISDNHLTRLNLSWGIL